MKADKRRATFGVAYWRRQHPNATEFAVGLYVMRRKWSRIGAALTRMARAMIPAFNGLAEHVRRAAVLMVEDHTLARAAAMSPNLALPGPLPAVLDDDEPEWYDGPNPWDAHSMTFDDTLNRIDQALTLHQEEGLVL